MKTYTFKLANGSNPFWLTVRQSGDFTLRNSRNDVIRQDMLLGTDTAEFELVLAAALNAKMDATHLEEQLTLIVQHYHKGMPVSLWSANLEQFAK